MADNHNNNYCGLKLSNTNVTVCKISYFSKDAVSLSAVLTEESYPDRRNKYTLRFRRTRTLSTCVRSEYTTDTSSSAHR